MGTEWTREKLNMELKQDRAAEKEIADLTQSALIQNIMQNVEKLRKLRKATSPLYTQKYLAEKAGIKRSTYLHYLATGRGIKVQTLLDFAALLRCDVIDLLKGDDKDEKSDLGNSR